MEPSQLERFEATVMPHLDAAYTLARYLTRNEPDAQDVVQEAYLRALRYFAGFHGTAAAEARGWVLTIVRRTAYTWQRRQRIGQRTTEFDEREHSESIADKQPDRALLRGDMRESLRRAIDDLPPEFREVIILREVQELSYKEISEVADVPVGTVMSRLARARTRLKQALTAEREER